MRNKLFIILALLMLIFTVNGAYAADGDLFTSGDFRINGTGQVVGARADYEVLTTNDTLTATESGKTIITNYNSAVGPLYITLPTAAAGLTYTFKNIAGHATSGWGVIELIPQSTDIFYGCVSSTATSTLTAGDMLYSAGATGDSLTIVGAPTAWYCTDREGTWVDGN